MLGWDATGDALIAPAVARNKDAILAVLRRVLPASGCVLEIASGSGEHAVHFAAALPGLDWQPSDPEPAALRSIAAHARRAALPNLRPPLALDVRAADWPVTEAAAMLAINMIHIAPWTATDALIDAAARLLPPEGPLILYGPFTIGGAHTAPSNAAFDASLRARDPAWGVRDVEAVAAVARTRGLCLVERVAMPANNLILVFRARARPTG
ncbi:DUF938 domain-containing protein [Methylobacterium sp. ID0610]|uniref:DUF938 domain-containing protein n=1 Tax=Methylobacterium carpenticola TaxID=3344827 RepID=UPI0036BA687D